MVSSVVATTTSFAAVCACRCVWATSKPSKILSKFPKSSSRRDSIPRAMLSARSSCLSTPVRSLSAFSSLISDLMKVASSFKSSSIEFGMPFSCGDGIWECGGCLEIGSRQMVEEGGK